ncbi:MAG: rhodanese-like domain-containing protein, partial [Chloroflexi bacterium]|nr:rhodanese-like domain-containing protein [Chloroflexota bacterium]
GAGSVCGTAIAERLWTTVGLERRLNPSLQHTDRAGFVAQTARELERPPYFRRMERWNLAGAPLLGTLPVPTPLSPGAFAQRAEEATVLDIRSELGFSAAHVPGALSIWPGGLASFAGWFLPYDQPILLVHEAGDPTWAVRTLVRLGYDDLAGTLADGMLAWHTAGRESQSVQTVTVQELCRRLDAHQEPWILDVRSDEEVAHARIPDAQHIHITQLPQHLDEVPRDRPVFVFCGSGLRATIAASILQRDGWRDVSVVLGGLAGWSSIICPLEL